MEAVTKLPVQSEVHHPTFDDVRLSAADVLFTEALEAGEDKEAVSTALRGVAELTNDLKLWTALRVLSMHVLGLAEHVGDEEVLAVYDLINDMQRWRQHCAEQALAEAS